MPTDQVTAAIESGRVDKPYFEHFSEQRLVVCTRCRYAVLPSHVASHLHRIHKVSQRKAAVVAEEVDIWPGLIQYASELEIPDYPVEPIQGLPIFQDGLMCQLNDHECRQILRSRETMKKHWRVAHSWKVGKGGRPSQVQQRGIEARKKEGCKPVHCQRFFVQGTGSQFFEVHQPADGETVASPASAWEQVQLRMRRTWVQVQENANKVIQDVERDAATPWLGRTQWARYLKGIEREALLASVEEPNADPNADPKKQEEPLEAAIWKATDEMIRFSQRTVVERIGLFVRMEAIRTEKHQTRYQPLQGYMDEKTIVKHSRAWKQIMMLFARTQREHEWTSPRYRFTAAQRRAWERVVEEAERLVGREEMMEEETVDEETAEEVDEEEEEEEEGEHRDEQGDEYDGTGEGGHQSNAQDEETLTSMQRACLQFCIELLDHKITRKEYDSPLVCALAVLGVREGGWKGPEQYPPILSAVIKQARFMVVQQAVELSGEMDEPEWVDSAYESDGNEERKGCLQLVSKMMDGFMVRGAHGPMQWMLDLRTYGLKIHYNTTAPGHVGWTGEDEMLYKSLQFNMRQFRSMVQGLAGECRRILMQELMFVNDHSKPVPPVPWSQLRDNPTDERPGWNFLQDHRTRLPAEGESWLMERVGQDEIVQRQMVRPESQTGLNRRRVDQYMEALVRFREKLLLLVHMSGGQPGRAPEVLSIRHINTAEGGHRNIFIEDGMVVFVTRYHKGYAVSGDVKVIHRYLPREVGELVVYYLWLVLPFAQQMEAVMYEKEGIPSHMWPADPSGRKWTAERMRKAMEQESQLALGQAMNVAAYREIAIGISRRYMRTSTAFDASEEEAEGGTKSWEDENGKAAIADEQAGHTSHIAGLIYARGMMEQTGAVAEKRQRFRDSSTDWHRFLGFESAWEERATTSLKRKRAPFEGEADEGRFDRWTHLRTMDVEEPLKRMMGNEAEFRGVQKPAMEAIMQGESSIVVVMPTGAGKSLLFMLPAFTEPGGTTVVVVPLIALREDMMRRCEELNISCAAWEGRRPPDAATVVLVTPESAVGEAFTTFLNRLKATRQLDRIVIDECHMVLNTSYTFRRQLQQMGRLVAAETQMILLTATLPPSEEDELFRRMHFQRSQVKMFREPTCRKNIRYQVARVKDREAIGFIQSKVAKVRVGKAVVYCNSVNKVKKISEKLGCHGYHHHAIGKAGMLRDFSSGMQRVIVATSALGMGVDISDIRLIIHADPPRTLLEYAQESGRAGRDRKRSEAVIMVPGRIHQMSEQSDGDWKLITQLIGEEDKPVCRRMALDEYLDVEPNRSHCREGEEQCDGCRGSVEDGEEAEDQEMEDQGETEDQEMEDQEETEDIEERVDRSNDDMDGSRVEIEAREDQEEVARAEQQRVEERRLAFQRQEQGRKQRRLRWMEQRRQQIGDMEWIQRQAGIWAGRCGICMGAGVKDMHHRMMDCRREGSQEVQALVQKIDKERRANCRGYVGCYSCGLPQRMCYRWEEDEQGGWKVRKGGRCYYEGEIIAGLIGIVYGLQGDIASWWVDGMRERGVEVEEDGAIGRYLAGEGYFDKEQGLQRVEASQLAVDFCWITRMLEADKRG